MNGVSITSNYNATIGSVAAASVSFIAPVHEMARDEARHGKAFAGLLKRYFG